MLFEVIVVEETGHERRQTSKIKSYLTIHNSPRSNSNFRGKIANFSRLHFLAIPRRDLSTKKTLKPNIEERPESLGLMLEFNNDMERWPFYIFCSQIMTEYINATFSLVNKIKMIGMPVYLVHR